MNDENEIKDYLKKELEDLAIIDAIIDYKGSKDYYEDWKIRHDINDILRSKEEWFKKNWHYIAYEGFDSNDLMEMADELVVEYEMGRNMALRTLKDAFYKFYVPTFLNTVEDKLSKAGDEKETTKA